MVAPVFLHRKSERLHYNQGIFIEARIPSALVFAMPERMLALTIAPKTLIFGEDHLLVDNC